MLENKLQATEMWLLRKLLTIPWTIKTSNEEVLQMANTERQLNTIRKRQLEFFGHIIRKESIDHLAITGKIEGKRARGRQRMTYVDGLCSFVTQKQSFNNELIHLSANRTKWKTIVVDAWNRQDT